MDKHSRVLVYLDTQDYINVFNEKDGGPKHKVLDRLLELRDEGIAEFGYSMFSVLEFITKPDARNREERVRRGALIKLICQSNTFPPAFELGRGATYPNSGLWAFSDQKKLIDADKFKHRARRNFLKKLKDAPGANRSEKRRLAKIGHEELLRQAGAVWGRTRSDYGDFPVSQEIVDSRLMERFLKGQCSNAEFEEKMISWLTDVEEYSRLVYDYRDEPNLIDKFFGATTIDLAAKADNLLQHVQRVAELNKKITSVRQGLVRAGMPVSEARRKIKRVKLPDEDYSGFVDLVAPMIGEHRVLHFQHYMSRMLRPGFSIKPSDFMDLMHLIYAYDCDLMRCDKAMGSLYSNFRSFRARLVTRFEDLPDAILRLHKENAGA